MTDAGHIISQLSPADAVAVLQALAASDEALAGRIAAQRAHLEAEIGRRKIRTS